MSVLKLNQIQTANGVIMANLNSSGANIGFQLASTLAPAFSAYLTTSDQSISDATNTKVTFNAEEFDTNGNFDSTTNYRFTPTVAGYYKVNSTVVYRQTTIVDAVLLLYKNGSSFKRGAEFSIASGANVTNFGMTVDALVYMNGTTDYLEVYAYSDGSGTPTLTLINGSSQTFFQAFLARSA